MDMWRASRRDDGERLSPQKRRSIIDCVQVPTCVFGMGA
jgi:hypothetical protein